MGAFRGQTRRCCGPWTFTGCSSRTGLRRSGSRTGLRRGRTFSETGCETLPAAGFNGPAVHCLATWWPSEELRPCRKFKILPGIPPWHNPRGRILWRCGPMIGSNSKAHYNGSVNTNKYKTILLGVESKPLKILTEYNVLFSSLQLPSGIITMSLCHLST